MENPNSPRKLSGSDRRALEDLLAQEPQYTLFFRGNLSTYGLEDPDLEYWGVYNLDGSLESILMRYRYNWSPYGSESAYGLESFGPEKADYRAYAVIADNHPAGLSFITGKPAIVRNLASQLANHRVIKEHPSFFCSVHELSAPQKETGRVRRATEADIPAMAELYREDEPQRDVQALARRIREGRFYLVEEGRLMVSAAGTTAETSDTAMIGGVFTPPALRRRGYASTCVYRLCKDLLAEGKTPCLFYFNPVAGSIYRRLGFKDIGPWLLLELQKNNPRPSPEIVSDKNNMG